MVSVGIKWGGLFRYIGGVVRKEIECAFGRVAGSEVERRDAEGAV